MQFNLEHNGEEITVVHQVVVHEYKHGIDLSDENNLKLSLKPRSNNERL